MTIHPVIDNCVYRSDRPATIADWQQLQKLGIKTVLNLEGGVIETMTQDLNLQNKYAFQCKVTNIFHGMNAVTPPDDRDVDTALQYLNSDTYWPILGHCKHGKSRTGYVMCAYEVVCRRVPYKEAYERMMALGFEWPYRFWVNSLASYCSERLQPGRRRAPVAS